MSWHSLRRNLIDKALLAYCWLLSPSNSAHSHFAWLPSKSGSPALLKVIIPRQIEECWLTQAWEIQGPLGTAVCWECLATLETEQCVNTWWCIQKLHQKFPCHQRLIGHQSQIHHFQLFSKAWRYELKITNARSLSGGIMLFFLQLNATFLPLGALSFVCI